MSKCLRILAGAVVLAAIAAGSSAVLAQNAPNRNNYVPPPGYPDFWSYNGSATVQETSAKDFVLSYSDIFSSKSCPSCAAVFNFPTGAYAVQNLDLTVTATFSSSGQFLSGSYSIAGALPAWSNPTYGTKPPGFNWTSTTSPLFTAKLTGVTENLSTDELGFNTSSFGGWADQKQFTAGSTSESVWLYAQLTCQTANQNQPLCTNSTKNNAWNAFLSELQSGKGLKTGSFTGMASIATVPLPAAALLFGSGLASLGAALRRRKLAVTAA